MKSSFLSYFFGFLMIIGLSASLASCHGKQDEPQPPTPPEEVKEVRTVLVYIVATNTLGSSKFDDLDIQEMLDSATVDNLNGGRLILYHAPYRCTPMLKEVTPEGLDTLKIYDDDVVSVSIQQMRQVISDTKEFAPADDYGLILWSHASGWLQDGIAEEPEEAPAAAQMPGMAYSYGSDYYQKMNITSLRTALLDQGFSFIYFDCCFMGSVEVMYELRDVASVMLASPTEVPVSGMPYHLNIKPFFADEADLIGAARNMIGFYEATYNTWDCPYSMTVVRSEHLEELALATRAIYEQAETSMPEGYSPQKFSTERVCYYFDLEDYVKTLCNDEALFKKWQEARDKAVEYLGCSQWIWGDFEVTRYGGLSTYILKNESAASTKGYNTLQWYDKVASSLF